MEILYRFDQELVIMVIVQHGIAEPAHSIVKIWLHIKTIYRNESTFSSLFVQLVSLAVCLEM